MCSSTAYSLRPAKEVILAFEIYPTKESHSRRSGPGIKSCLYWTLHACAWGFANCTQHWLRASLHACMHTQTKSFLVLRNSLAPQH